MQHSPLRQCRLAKAQQHSPRGLMCRGSLDFVQAQARAKWRQERVLTTCREDGYLPQVLQQWLHLGTWTRHSRCGFSSIGLCDYSDTIAIEKALTVLSYTDYLCFQGCLPGFTVFSKGAQLFKVATF